MADPAVVAALVVVMGPALAELGCARASALTCCGAAGGVAWGGVVCVAEVGVAAAAFSSRSKRIRASGERAATSIRATSAIVFTL